MKTFKEFILEARQIPPEEVTKTINRNWNRQHPGSNFNLQYRHSDEPGKSHLYVGLIDIKKGKRGRGTGTRFLNAAKNVADERGLPLSVKPVAPVKRNQKRLEGWYRSHDFEDNISKDISPHPMIRHPKKQ